MKALIFILSIFILQSHATTIISCRSNEIRTWDPAGFFRCVPRFDVNTPDVFNTCWGPPQNQPQFLNFAFPFYHLGPQPWWAAQGQLYYPNVTYPGPWNYPGIQSHYYPGEGQIFAAKPNVYIESVIKNIKFTVNFTSNQKLSFLATTPQFNKFQGWSGKIIDNDKFEVGGVAYDYLFYDIRLPKEKMQFDRGVCTTRSDAILFMLNDLREMKYPLISLQDFEEHWKVKIPDYPYYCIYPQYNHELDPILPVAIGLEQASFIRSLYVLVPHKKGPDSEETQEIPLPRMDPAEFRPGVKILRENMFREWGVAFLGN